MIPPQNSSFFSVFLYIVIAYTFGVLFRLTLAYTASHHPEFYYSGRILPLWTPDAGLYGHYAKVLLSGGHLPYDNVHMMGHLLYAFSSVSGLHIDTVMFYTPALLAPLVVIPIILIMSQFQLVRLGFFAALIASIGFNFYYRTHLGYTDTDLLIYFFVLFIIYSMIAVARHNNFHYGLIGAFSILLLGSWYHSYKVLVASLLLFYFVYILLFDRKQSDQYGALLLFAAALVPESCMAKYAAIVLAVAMFSWIKYAKASWLNYRSFLLFSAFAAVAAVFTGIGKRYYVRIIEYFDKEQIYQFTDQAGTLFEFSGMLGDILEAKALPIRVAVEFMAGSPYLFILAVIGLGMLAIRFRSALLLFPLLFLGLASTQMGLRFTSFAIAMVAIGIVYFIAVTAHAFQEKTNKFFGQALFYAILLFSLGYTASESIAFNGSVVPKYTADQAEAMQSLSSFASDNDYVISFWDNGWPLWYTTGLKTLTHNGKHSYDSFLIAQILMSSNAHYSANMSRYFLEKYDPWYEKGSIFRRLSKTEDMKKLLLGLKEPDVSLPEKTFDIYYYLDDKTILKLPLIRKYAHSTMEPDEKLIYTFVAKPPKDGERYLYGVDFNIDLQAGTIVTSEGSIAVIGNLIVSNGEKFRYKQFNKGANLNVILYKNRYIFAVSDDFLRSFAVSAYLLNLYDKNLFEMVSITENSKILKLKK